MWTKKTSDSINSGDVKQNEFAKDEKITKVEDSTRAFDALTLFHARPNAEGRLYRMA